MLEMREHEIAAQLAVDARQQVEIERRRDAGRIVVSGQQLVHGLYQIRAQQQRIAGIEAHADLPQKIHRARLVEIADRASEKKNQNGLAALRSATTASSPSRYDSLHLDQSYARNPAQLAAAFDQRRRARYRSDNSPAGAARQRFQNPAGFPAGAAAQLRDH